ncbi:MAG TPA: VOC family protein [Devosia sp.]|nr:VOC family protein [Devosia sp.]
MATVAKNTTAPLMPTMRYRDCNKALDFLTKVFGFTEGNAYRDDKGNVMHAELWFGNGGIMIGPVADTPFGKVMRQPDEAGGVTASYYCVVDDPDAHHARSQAAGFDIFMPLRDESYGSREYSVRDPEGFVWTFGTYDPQPKTK